MCWCFLNVITYQHGLENVFDHKCPSLEMLGYLATSPKPGLPMPPKLFIGTEQSSMFGEEGYDLTGVRELVAVAPRCFIWDSILGLHNMSNPEKHQFRNCHELLYDNGFRNHLMKCMPCASMPQLACAIFGYLDLIGAGH